MTPAGRLWWIWWTAASALLVILAVELWIAAREQAQTPDEAVHLLAGARFWKYRDLGTNPEHPPLAKLVAALPILGVPVPPPAPYTEFYKRENSASAVRFLYTQDADAMLLRARMAASLFTLVLAVLVAAAGCEIFGRSAGLVALLLFAFEPTLLAHGSLVTTDMGAACCFFGAVYAFYRWRKEPTAARLTICGLASGLALAVKHSGAFLLPVLCVLALIEWAGDRGGRTRRQGFQTILKLAAIGATAYAVLWAFYCFRYSARPAGMAMVPTLAAYAASTHSALVEGVVTRLAAARLLPEAYLFGLVDIVNASGRDPMFLLGVDYPSGRWFYFPIAFLIKSTLGLLGLLAAVPFLRGLGSRREMAFLLIPPSLYFAVCLRSPMDTGVRHILPIYPFLILIAATAAVALARRRPWGACAAAALVLGHVVSSASVFPWYLTYANEAWGGPSNTFRLLADSNADWNEGLRAAAQYLKSRGIRDCWFAHYGWNVDPAYYDIPCRALPEGLKHWFDRPLPPVPAAIEGTVLVSGSEADGEYWGPGELNPYAQFLHRRPDALIANSILVFRGRFDVPLLSALAHVSQARRFEKGHQLDQALSEVRAALDLAPGSAEAHATLGDLLLHLGRTAEARGAFREAISLAAVNQPEFQFRRILRIPAPYLPGNGPAARR
jgi:hypothetical protein